MATFRKVTAGWRAEVCVNRQRFSATRDTKKEAEAWARGKEVELKAMAENPVCQTAFHDVLSDYANQITIHKKSAANEIKRIRALQNLDLANKAIGLITSRDIADWKAERMKEVKPSTVARDLTLIKHVFSVAKTQWGLIRDNPAAEIPRPPKAPPRERLITEEEIALICAAHGYVFPNVPVLKVHRVCLSFLFALETAMRSGEICNLKKADIQGRVANLPETKNGYPRQVPLSAKALQILDLLPTDSLFDLDPIKRDVIFRNAVTRSGVKSVRFHDTRHTAITALSKKLDVLELARMTGHRNLNELLTYYHAGAEALADKL